MLTKLQKLREEREEGFTLIELLVVILIIGILSAIAIPAFMNQRKSAVDSSVQADLTSISKEIATLDIKNGGKVEAITLVKVGDIWSLAVGGIGAQIQTSKGNTFSVHKSNSTATGTPTSASTNGYSIIGTNTSGDTSVTGITYDSLIGGAQW